MKNLMYITFIALFGFNLISCGENSTKSKNSGGNDGVDVGNYKVIEVPASHAVIEVPEYYTETVHDGFVLLERSLSGDLELEMIAEGVPQFYETDVNDETILSYLSDGYSFLDFEVSTFGGVKSYQADMTSNPGITVRLIFFSTGFDLVKVQITWRNDVDLADEISSYGLSINECTGCPPSFVD
jgi:hypothetical protein